MRGPTVHISSTTCFRRQDSNAWTGLHVLQTWILKPETLNMLGIHWEDVWQTIQCLPEHFLSWKLPWSRSGRGFHKYCWTIWSCPCPITISVFWQSWVTTLLNSQYVALSSTCFCHPHQYVTCYSITVIEFTSHLHNQTTSFNLSFALLMFLFNKKEIKCFCFYRFIFILKYPLFLWIRKFL